MRASQKISFYYLLTNSRNPFWSKNILSSECLSRVYCRVQYNFYLETVSKSVYILKLTIFWIMIWQELNQNCNTFLVNLIVNCLQLVGSLSQEAAKRITQKAARGSAVQLVARWTLVTVDLRPCAFQPSTATASYVFSILAVAASGITQKPAKTAKGGTVSHRLHSVLPAWMSSARPLDGPCHVPCGSSRARKRRSPAAATINGNKHPTARCIYRIVDSASQGRNKGTGEQGTEWHLVVQFLMVLI